MDWMFFVKNRFWWITHGGASILRIPPNWKRAGEICAAFSYKCLQSLLALYVTYKQMRYYGRQQWRTLPMHSSTMTVEEKQEIYQRLEALEYAVNGLSNLAASEERLIKLEGRITNQQEILQRFEALEDSLSRPDISEVRLIELASQIADLQQETHRRLEVLESSLSRLSTSEERFVELEGRTTNLQQEIARRIEEFEGTLQSLRISEEHPAELASRVTQPQQVSSPSERAIAAPEERKPVLLTARNFAARHGVDWNQMQAWLDTQALTPALSLEGLPDYLLTPDQQSMLIRYWKSRKIPYNPCKQCPHYVVFGLGLQT